MPLEITGAVTSREDVISDRKVSEQYDPVIGGQRDLTGVIGVRA